MNEVSVAQFHYDKDKQSVCVCGVIVPPGKELEHRIEHLEGKHAGGIPLKQHISGSIVLGERK